MILKANWAKVLMPELERLQKEDEIHNKAFQHWLDRATMEDMENFKCDCRDCSDV